MRKVSYREAITSPYWFSLKRDVEWRCAGRCEFCYLGYGHEQHHRTYERLGQERPEDVMLLCGACHDAIHHGGEVMVLPGCLAHTGDTGFNSTPQWAMYMENPKEFNGGLTDTAMQLWIETLDPKVEMYPIQTRPILVPSVVVPGRCLPSWGPSPAGTTAA